MPWYDSIFALMFATFIFAILSSYAIVVAFIIALRRIWGGNNG